MNDSHAEHVVVLGAGVTGLSFCYHLERLAREHRLPLRITLHEASGSIGGKVQTEIRDGFVIEQGAESLFMQKPGIREILTELGLQEELISPLRNEFSILHGSRLHPLDPRILAPFPDNAAALWQAPFLSRRAKLRVSITPIIPGIRRPRLEERSIAECLRSRWGTEFSRIVLEPLLAGIHGGDAEELSIDSLYPHLASPSSIPAVRDLWRVFSARKASPRRAVFQSLRSGLGCIPRALASRLECTSIVTSSQAVRVRPEGSGVRIRLRNGRDEQAGAVFVAIPAYAAAKVLSLPDTNVASLLESIPFASSLVVTLAYPASIAASSLRGTGHVSTAETQSLVKAVTFSSFKWDHRAPNGQHLLRAYLGNSRSSDLVDTMTDEEISSLAIEELGERFGLPADPLFTLVHRWPRSLPQYTIGHRDRIARIIAALRPFPQIGLGGASYRGLGIPDCLRQGKECAEQLFTHLRTERESSTGSEEYRKYAS